MLSLEEKIDFLIERVLALESVIYARDHTITELVCAKTQTPPPVQMCNDQLKLD